MGAQRDGARGSDMNITKQQSDEFLQSVPAIPSVYHWMTTIECEARLRSRYDLEENM